MVRSQKSVCSHVLNVHAQRACSALHCFALHPFALLTLKCALYASHPSVLMCSCVLAMRVCIRNRTGGTVGKGTKRSARDDRRHDVEGADNEERARITSHGLTYLLTYSLTYSTGAPYLFTRLTGASVSLSVSQLLDLSLSISLSLCLSFSLSLYSLSSLSSLSLSLSLSLCLSSLALSTLTYPHLVSPTLDCAHAYLPENEKETRKRHNTYHQSKHMRAKSNKSQVRSEKSENVIKPF